MKSLSQIFSEENQRNGQGRFTNLSAEGGTNVKDAIGDPRLRILNECGRLGKVLRKPDGSQFSSNELFAMPLDELQALFDKTPADSSRASQTSDAGMSNQFHKGYDGTKPLVNMAGIFERDNAITCLSATGRFDSSSKGKEDAERLEILRRLQGEGKTILKDGLNPYNAKELLKMDINLLRVVAPNCQAVRFIV